MALSPMEQDRLAELDAEHGDAWEPPSPSKNSRTAPPPIETRKPRWPLPIPVTELPDRGPAVDWILHGMIAAGHITLISALFKSGKTTLESHLLRSLQCGHEFIGRQTRQCRTLIVSEESQGTWRLRRDALGLDDHLHLLCRPMFAKPSFPEWREFLDYITEIAVGNFDLVIFDTLGAFAPWRNENDAAEAQATLTPFFQLTEAGLAVVLFHHFGKSDGTEGRAARGSTAIGGAVDVMLELRRYKSDDLDDRRRVLSGLGRFDEIPSEVVLVLAEDGSGYTATGDKKAEAAAELRTAILDALPTDPTKGATAEDVHNDLPEGLRPRRGDVAKALQAGASTGAWHGTGTGKRNDPRRFWIG